MKGWKWDWQHIVLLIAFALGVVWYFESNLYGKAFTSANVTPLLGGVILFVGAFLKNPPNNPRQAFDEGSGGAGPTGPTAANKNAVEREADRLSPPPPAAQRTWMVRAGLLVVIVLFGFGIELFMPSSYAVDAAIGCKPGTIPTAVTTIAPPTEACASKILNDALAGMTIEQILADVDQVCSVDLLTIITTLVSSTNASIPTTTAYGQAMKLRAALTPAPIPSASPVLPAASHR